MGNKYLTIIQDFYQTIKSFLVKEGLDGKNQANLLGKIVTVIIIYFVVEILKTLINKLIINKLRKSKMNYIGVNENRATTLINILNKTISGVLTFIGVLMALDVFNFPTSSILATAGIGGIAIGFGTQSLVKDLITGFFILLEDQYSVGDHVEIQGKDGIVEDLGLRVTKIRDFGGELYIIPNSSITLVTNKTRGSMRSRVILSIAYEEDVDKALKVLEEYNKRVWQKQEIFIEGPTIVGVSSLSEYSVDITIIARTKPMDQWQGERIIRKDALDLLKRENIEIPYKKQVIYKGDE